MKTEIKNREWVKNLINEYPSIETGVYEDMVQYVVQIADKLNLVTIDNDDNVTVEVIDVDDALYAKLGGWYSIDELEEEHKFNFNQILTPEEKMLKKIEYIKQLF